MINEYKKLEAVVYAMEGSYTDAEARSALPKLVSALNDEDVTASSGEIIAICELVLQLNFNGVKDMDPDTRDLFLPDEEVSRQASRL